MAAAQVLFAESEIQVHIAVGGPVKDPQGNEVWDIQSRILSPGDSVPFSDLPRYVQEAAKKGEITGASVMSASRAKTVAEHAKKLRDISAGPASTEALDAAAVKASAAVEDAVDAAALEDEEDND